MKIHIALAFSVLGVIAAASTASAQVQLTMEGGHVTLSAKSATIRQILAEWERVGQTKVVNGDRLPGVLLNLELPNMPEQQALDIILRTVSGVLFAPRTELAAGNISAFSQIILMPPSIAPPPSSGPSTPLPPAFGQQTTYPQQMQFQGQQPVSDDDDRPTVAQPRPVFVFPQPQITNPGGQPQFTNPSGALAQPQMPPLMFPQQGAPANPPAPPFPGAAVATPGGVSIPGMVVPAPAPQPGQPGFGITRFGDPAVPPQPQPAPPRTTP